MKFKLCLSLLWAVLSLDACQNQSNLKGELQTTQVKEAIVGGSVTSDSDPQGRHVVWLANESSCTSCSGTLIANNLVLTAAHCVGSSGEGLTLAFGVNPASGAYQLRTSDKSLVHPQYQKNNLEDRNDLAIVHFSGGLPSGYAPAHLPDSNLPIKTGLQFTALGYGRNSGKKTENSQDHQGSGVLRSVTLEVNSISDDQMQFRVDQSNGQGICAGDSGGPAIVKYMGTNYVIGVASAILWTVPQELNGDEKNRYIETKDFCSEKSIYMNLINFLPWIKEASDQLQN